VNYEETLAYLYAQLPMFTRIGAAAYKKDLTNTLALCHTLCNPHHQFKSVHIAGTNGKGSTSHMLAAIFQQAGYKTGLYTSPHLIDFRERIRINGEMIPKEYVVEFVKKYKKDFECIQPSFFEWTVALCFNYFAQQQVDIAIIETGLGGRLDSTNVVSPLLSVITNIGWDHMDMLGDTLPKIAFEKAGIIKPNTPVVLGSYQHETFPVFEEKAQALTAPLIKAFEKYSIQSFSQQKDGTATCEVLQTETKILLDYHLQLGGIYQQYNLQGVLAAVEQLQKIGYSISAKDISLGLANTVNLTSLMGRWQVLQYHPLIVCDTAHNINGIELVLQQIKLQQYEQLHVVLGMVKDKDISKILSLLPPNAIYYFCNADLPRALHANDLQQLAMPYQLQGSAYKTVADAYKAALSSATPNDMVYVGGSTFVVAEVLALLS
jgi:dihydrofolate synthase/folylpolyglutamate synthase